MTIDEVVQILNASQPKPLTALQEWLLRQAWEGKTYTSMALEANYVEEYLRKTASALWSNLSEFWGEPIAKNNFRSKLEPRRLTKAQQQLIKNFHSSAVLALPEFPGSPLSVSSDFYIFRPPIEQLAYEEITKPGSLIRIKAPSKFGKSSLSLRLMAHAATRNYRTVLVDFQQAEKAVFATLNKFLRWFCANVSRELQLESKLDDFWDENVGRKVSCSIYFEAYLLKQIPSPLVLTFNSLNRVFAYPEVAQEFLTLLRVWHEQAKNIQTWEKLRIVLSYSTEIDFPLKLNQSPFNIGLPLKLPGFTLEQVQELAKRYGLDEADSSKAKRLMAMLGGHPYLTQLAFYYLSRQEVTLKQLLEQTAIYSTGIYNDHLMILLEEIEENPQIKNAFKQALSTNQPVKIEPIIAEKLNSMGLVKIEGDRVFPSCELYRLYFQNKLLTKNSWLCERDPGLETAFRHQLETERQNLQYLLNIDEITQVANRDYFNIHLQTEWQRSRRERISLSLILCEIDYLETDNDVDGDLAAEKCLRQVAFSIEQAIHSSSSSAIRQTDRGDLIARYERDRFAVILPQTDVGCAVKVGENIQRAINLSAILINNSQKKAADFPKNIISASLGNASTIAHAGSDYIILINAAEEALERSKKEGRDRITFLEVVN